MPKPQVPLLVAESVTEPDLSRHNPAGGIMAKHVRGDVLLFERGTLLLCGGNVLSQNELYAIGAEFTPSTVGEERIIGLWILFFEPCLEDSSDRLS